MKKYISIKEVSVLIGVTTTTLRRWDIKGLLKTHHRTIGNHRRYELSSILAYLNPCRVEISHKRKVICYARVSSYDQKGDLERQSTVLNEFCIKKGFKNVEVIKDLGSGLNFKKKGLKKLINSIITNQVDKIILTHKDRLLRFGSDLLINIANHFNTETVILNETVKTFEEELSSNVLEIITVFSAKLYGSRSHKNKQKQVLNI